jgi:uncharacterized protein (TIGR02996 family)
MPSEEELRSAIDANPDDDAPRLAHADWLQAHGDPERAAYIRSALRTEGDIDYLRTRGLPTVHGMSWECRRGYPEVVRFESLTAFRKGWPLAAAHRVRHVVFRGLRSAARLADEPALASIRSLEMSGIDTPAILAVLRSPHLGPLHHLAVGVHYPEDLSFLPELARMPLLAGLRSLSYSFLADALPEEPVAALLASPYLGGLRALRFNGWLSAAALRALWRSSSLSGLTVLEVLSGGGWSGGSTNPGGLDDLGDGAATPALERFRFEYPAEAKEGRAVAGATRWTRLRELEIGDCGIHTGPGIGDAGAAALAGAAHLGNLERLVLRQCGISDAGAVALAGSRLRSLSWLDLFGNVIGRAGVAAFGRTEELPRLRMLILEGNPAPAALIEAVAARFREGGPPLEEIKRPPVAAAPAPSAPVVGAADEDGLVRALWADPFDELPRLAYADWLEEQAAPLHATILRAPPAERARLAGPLFAAMNGDAPFPFQGYLAEEGLVCVSIPVRSLRSKACERDGPAWLRRHHVAEVSPQGTPSDWKALFAAGWLAQARGLRLQGRLHTTLPALAASPHLAGLASLALSSQYIREDAFAAFFREAGLRGLCRLSRPDYYLPVEALKAIAEAAFVANLRHLDTGMINNEALAVLAESPAFAGLSTLSFLVDGDSGAKILADASELTSLRNLDLSGAWFGDLGLDALAGSALLPCLVRLRLSTFGLSTPALERLARALPPRCRLVLAGETEAPRREALSAVLGDRLIVEGP